MEDSEWLGATRKLLLRSDSLLDVLQSLTRTRPHSTDLQPSFWSELRGMTEERRTEETAGTKKDGCWCAERLPGRIFLCLQPMPKNPRRPSGWRGSHLFSCIAADEF